jgi:hypothetical protein
MRWGRIRKFLAVALLGVVEAAAYVATDPRDLPSWVVTGALAVNAAAVYLVRNDRPTRDELLRRLNERPVPPRQDDVAGPARRHLKGDRPIRGDDPPSTIP